MTDRVKLLEKRLKPPWPRPELPAIVVAGRSNVGKSSLLNRLLGRRRLAPTAKAPGRTRSITFYLVDEAWVLADLPGYGYARVSKQLQARWATAIRDYLEGASAPVAALCLVDGRHPPQPLDVDLWAYLGELGIDRLLVLTKADKVKRGRRRQAQRQAAATLGIRHDAALWWTSSASEEGIYSLRRNLDGLVVAARQRRSVE